MIPLPAPRRFGVKGALRDTANVENVLARSRNSPGSKEPSRTFAAAFWQPRAGGVSAAECVRASGVRLFASPTCFMK